MGAVKAVFRSWDNPRANVYRRDERYPLFLGHRCQRADDGVSATWATTCGTGVAFTRNPATGEKKLFGEFLMNAQGEDVVAGVRTPHAHRPAQRGYARGLRAVRGRSAIPLENHYRDMQDMEFTIEDKKLYMLQTRNGKRTRRCRYQDRLRPDRRGHDRPSRKLLLMMDPKQLDALLHPQFDPAALKAAKPVATALAASPGAACGKIVFTAEDAAEQAQGWREGCPGSSGDLSRGYSRACSTAQGILTVRGGMTSHAAVVARGMGTCCVSGCGDIKMDEENKKFDPGRP